VLSIVVALTGPASAAVPPAVAALAPRCHGRRDRELIVVTSCDGAPAVASSHPEVRLIAAPRGELAPVLWAEGIRAARGDAVAITVGECEPEPGWEDELYAALREADVAGVGAAIDPPSRPARLLDWAVYFCRYAPYGRPVRDATGLAVPGDSAGYRTADLARVSETWRDGFWEPEVHAALAAAGRRVRFLPGAAVRYQGGAALGDFLVARFRHGRHFGQDRARNSGPARRAARIVLAPLVPLVLWTRAGRHVLARGRWLGRFAAATPLLALFYSAWATGELAGTLAAPGVGRGSATRSAAAPPPSRVPGGG
jgi:hypothetical protein